MAKVLTDMKSGAVTLLDVLGWKGIWQRKDNPIKDLIDIIECAKTKMEEVKNSTKFGDLAELVETTKIISISDTIAIVTHGKISKSLELHAGLCRTIIRQSLKSKIPLRGAICYGKFSLDGSILAGPAIDEVASWYEISEWIGVIQTPSAYLQCNTLDFTFKNLLKEYEVPTKVGKVKTNCVNWTTIISEDGFGEDELKNMFIEMQPITPDISVKIMNTLHFYEKYKNEKDE